MKEENDAERHLHALEALAAEAALLSEAAAKVNDLRVASQLVRERRELALAIAEARKDVLRWR